MIALIIEAALRSLILSVIVWLAVLALRPRNPHLQKTVWITVLLASVAMPLVLKTRVAPSFDVPASVITLTQSMTGTAGAAHGAVWLSQLNAITVAYVLIVIALLTRFAVGLFTTWRIRRGATPLPNHDDADVRVSAKIASPATFGSTILLPASSAHWSDPTLAAILSHERSHVRYWDCYVQWLAHLHACVFWFNPLAWWLSRRLADLAETTSDDAVLKALPDRTAYADLLLEIARHPAPTLVTSAARSNISARIERILSDIPPALPPRRWVRGAAVTALIPLFMLAATTAQSPPPPHRTPPLGAGDSADPMAPKIVSWSNDESNYPAKAMRWGMEGLVTVNATIDAEGVVTYVQVVEEDPATDEYGFAEAAVNTAKQVRFSNPTRRPRQVMFKVKFALPEKHRADAPLPTTPINAAPQRPLPPDAANPPR